MLLDSYIAGLEAMTVIGNGVNLAHYELGWHSTSTIGGMGVAAAAARLCKFDMETTTRAISLAFSMASGSKIQFGTMAKPLHAGIAAMNGLLAARYAEAGITAASEPLDGIWSLRIYMVAMATRLPKVPKSWVSHCIGTIRAKGQIHPCCASVHTAVDALVDLMNEHDLQVDEINPLKRLSIKSTMTI